MSAVAALRRFALVGFVTTALLFAYTVWQSYVGRLLLRDAQVTACERGRRDRSANALGWRTAEVARRKTGTATDLEAARRYAEIAFGLEARAHINCREEFPHPTLFP